MQENCDKFIWLHVIMLFTSRCVVPMNIWCYNYIQKFHSLAWSLKIHWILILFFLGILCGTCENGGVSVLFDRCVSCSNAFITLVPLLGKLQWHSTPPGCITMMCYYYNAVVVQVALFITIVLIDRQFWSILYPFTFYVQVSVFLCMCEG